MEQDDYDDKLDYLKKVVKESDNLEPVKQDRLKTAESFGNLGVKILSAYKELGKLREAGIVITDLYIDHNKVFFAPIEQKTETIEKTYYSANPSRPEK